MSEVLLPALDVLLVVGVLGAAVLVLFWPGRAAAVVMFLAFGILLAVLWARLGAPDVALAEAAIGAGVTGALLLDAVTERPEAPHRPGRPRWGVPVAGALAAAVIAAVLGAAVRALPDPAPPGIGPSAVAETGRSGVDHAVTAVLLNFRSYDTLLEVAVLLVAGLAALSLQPSASLDSVPLPSGAPAVLDTTVRVLVPVLLVLAGWLLVAGSTRPGGAFQAGAVLAGCLVLLRLAGRAAPPLSVRWLRPGLVLGLAAFLLVAYLTALLGAGWLVLDPRWAGAVILVVEAALALSIGVTLAAVIVADQEPRGPEEPR